MMTPTRRHYSQQERKILRVQDKVIWRLLLKAILKLSQQKYLALEASNVLLWSSFTQKSRIGKFFTSKNFLRVRVWRALRDSDWLKEFSDYLESSLHEFSQREVLDQWQHTPSTQSQNFKLGCLARGLPFCSRFPAIEKHWDRICGSDNVNHACKSAYTIFWRSCGWHPPSNPASLNERERVMAIMYHRERLESFRRTIDLIQLLARLPISTKQNDHAAINFAMGTMVCLRNSFMNPACPFDIFQTNSSHRITDFFVRKLQWPGWTSKTHCIEGFLFCWS